MLGHYRMNVVWHVLAVALVLAVWLLSSWEMIVPKAPPPPAPPLPPRPAPAAGWVKKPDGTWRKVPLPAAPKVGDKDGTPTNNVLNNPVAAAQAKGEFGKTALMMGGISLIGLVPFMYGLTNKGSTQGPFGINSEDPLNIAQYVGAPMARLAPAGSSCSSMLCSCGAVAAVAMMASK